MKQFAKWVSLLHSGGSFLPKKIRRFAVGGVDKRSKLWCEVIYSL